MNSVIELKGKRFVQAAKNGRNGGPSMNSKRKVTKEHMINLIGELNQIKDFWQHETRPFQGALVSVFYNKIVAKSNRISGLLKGKDSNFSIVGAKFNAEKNKHIITYFVDVKDLDKSIELLSKSCDVVDDLFEDGLTQSIFNDKKYVRIRSSIIYFLLDVTEFSLILNFSLLSGFQNYIISHREFMTAEAPKSPPCFAAFEFQRSEVHT